MAWAGTDDHPTDLAKKTKGMLRVDDRRVLYGIFWILH
jgi:hypothetical protein